MIRASTSAGPPIDPFYTFKCITFPNRYWKEPLVWPRAKPVGRAPEFLNRQIQHLELTRIPDWIEGAAQIRQRNLQRNLQARADWEEHCLELEIASFPEWKQACTLWNQPGWISKRISLAVQSRAEVARQQAFAPAMVAPTMTMYLDQPIAQSATVISPCRRASTATENNEVSRDATKERARRSSAQ